ncbi:MAG: hypothetical protein ACR2FN_12005 [Chitinophagaceae bacterium]
MRKTVSLILFFVTVFTLVNAQTNSKSSTADNNINLKVYQQSISLNDYGTAINALHYLIAGDAAKYANWQDTLALLYTRTNDYQQGFLLSDALLNSKGYTDLRMEIKAVCAKQLQQPVEAINAYGILFTKTHNAVYGFEELQLQYAIRRLAETVATGNDLLKIILPNDSTQVNVMKLDGKNMQQVSLKAATENVLGLAYIDLKDKQNAVAQLQMALKENPDFEQAKNNLNVANALGSDAKK